MPSPSDCSMIARVAFAVLGIVLGVLVACVFGAVYDNINASVWGLISGFAAALTLYVHVTHVKGWYEEDPMTLRRWMYSGCFFQLIGLCGLVVYIVLGVQANKGVVIYGPGYFIAAVWCFMTLKWGFQLFFFSRTYWRAVIGASRLLPPPPPYTYDSAGDYGIKS
ncbi:hypothetical protein ACOMHN_055855 [Nucella lapillus]